MEMESIKLSISKGKATNKAQAGQLTVFKLDELDLEALFDVEMVFRERNYSTNVWKDGQRAKANYIGMTGVCLDIDDGMTIDEAKLRFSPLKYILHTSTSHQVAKHDKPACDRFRIILPFRPQDDLYYPTIDQAERVFESIKQMFPFCDPETLEPARHFYPFLGEEDKFIREVHLDGEWFSISSDQLVTRPNAEVVKAKKKIGRKGSQYYIQHDQKILMADGNTEQTIETLRTVLQNVDKQKLPCYCPFCDDIESLNASATVQLTSTHFIQLYCSHCESVGGGQQFVYWEDPIEPGMFMLEDKVVRVMKNKNNAYIVKVSDDYFMEGDKCYAKQYLCRARCIPTADLKVENHASVKYPQVDYHLDIPAGLLSVEIPTAISTDKKDNGFINRWIEQLFGVHADFIKDWMALYCFTNYQALPVLVLKGPRGCGKTTFGEVMAEIFPDFSDSWGGESTNFTPFFKKKLLLIEENDGNKKEQYVQLKQTKPSGESLTRSTGRSVGLTFPIPASLLRHTCAASLQRQWSIRPMQLSGSKLSMQGICGSLRRDT